MPAQLRVREVAAEQPDSARQGAIGDGDGVRLVRETDKRDDGRRSSAGTVASIARAYRDNPSKRDYALDIPGCSCSSYAGCFRQLRDEPADGRLEPAIHFAPLRFRDADLSQERIILYLDRLVKPVAVDSERQGNPQYYRMAVVTKGWAQRTQTRFRTELRNRVVLQRENWRRRWSDGAVYVFFLASRESNEAEFFVDRYQHIVFLEMNMDQIATL